MTVIEVVVHQDGEDFYGELRYETDAGRSDGLLWTYTRNQKQPDEILVEFFPMTAKDVTAFVQHHQVHLVDAVINKVVDVAFAS